MPVTITTPNILTDAGYLLWAALGVSEPTNTVVGSVFTDTWPVGWKVLGATEDGSEFTYESNIEAITVAEFFDPIRYATTERSGNFSFNLADYTLNNLSRAFNGGTITPVSGSGTTALNSYVPPTPGNEVRAQIGWESLDKTVRIVCYQTLQGGTVTSAFKKAPDKALIPCTFNFEVPSAGTPWKMFTAGSARLGA